MGEDRWREKHFEAHSPTTPVVWTGWAEDADGLLAAFADDLQLAPGQPVRVRDISQLGVAPQVGDTFRQEEGVVVGEVWDDPDGRRFVRVRLSPTTST